jgi:putative restriction endonuclease
VRNPEIIELAKILELTPGSVSYKLANFAKIDPSLERKGASHVSKLDVEVWNEFLQIWMRWFLKVKKVCPDQRRWFCIS